MTDENDLKRELLILRHGKSDWDSDAATDFDRPLAKRGARDAPRMGRWLAERDLLPDVVLSSPARRARETARSAVEAMGLDEQRIAFDERVYGATTGELLRVLADVREDAARVMIVGHNPGLEDLVLYLASGRPEVPSTGKLMPTCALARLAMPASWADVPQASARLQDLLRPKEMKD